MSISTQLGDEARATDVDLAIVNPAGLYDPAPNGYSHVVVAQGGSRVEYIAGQGGEDTRGALSSAFEEQLEQAYANLALALAAVDARPEQVARITTYVVDHDEAKLAVLSRHVRRLFGDSPPAQTLVPVPRLALDGMLFEVDAIAILD